MEVVVAAVATKADEEEEVEAAAVEAETTGKTTRIRPVRRNRRKTFRSLTFSKKSCPERQTPTRTKIPALRLLPLPRRK